MATYILCRRKHLYTLKLHTVSPSVTKKVPVYMVHVAGYNNKSDNMISVM